MKRNALFNKVIRTGKMVLPLYLFTFLPLSMMAQDDDMYFVPTKENVAKEAKKYGMPEKTYYSGSNRSVDDYNRRALFRNPADTTGNDIIDFSAVRGVYPDSIYMQPAENDDYKLTRRMSRFDDYTPNEAYWAGYNAGRWSSPWRTSWYSWYDYDPWYWDSWWYWRDPFYYSSWYGWRYPYYYSAWYSPYYYGSYRYYGGLTTYRPSTSSERRGRGYDSGRSFGRSSNDRTTTVNSNRAFGTTSRTNNSSPSFGSSSSRSSSSSGGSFGGGGGGGRSTSGGRSFGGRR